ncbi:MAG: hypothetical protein JXB47_20150 [Anaerolineae bacterium]|nr:hypothetical protein [Anaerolineae bacterium]
MMRKRKTGCIALAVTTAVLSVWLAWQFLPPLVPPPGLPAGYTAEKAVWLGVAWSMDAHSDTEIEALARDLQAHSIAYAFVYVSYLKPGDFFNPTYDYAAHFVERMHAAAPNVILLGWLGVPIQVTAPDGTYITNRLSDPRVREVIAGFSEQVVNEMGFDGVHLNAEAVVNDDLAFIKTLQTIRAELPAGALLSIAGHAMRITERATHIPYPVLPHNWSAEYLRQVAQHVDQIAVMTYDSGLIFPSDYRSWMAYQARSIANALEDLDVHVLIGIPAFEEETLSHHAAVEATANALYGLRMSFVESVVPVAINGIAVYPYWEIDGDEWAALDAFPSSLDKPRATRQRSGGSKNLNN